MKTFGKEYSAVYDSLYSDQDFKKEAANVAALANELLLPVSRNLSLLNLGCGTGNHDRYFRHVFDLTGVDLSEDMLKIAREKFPDGDYRQGDARTIDLGKRFDVVCMMSAVLGYQNTNEDILATLKNVRKHLKPGGLFVFDVWNGPAILLEKPSPRLKELVCDGTHLLRSMVPSLCTERNTVTCHYKWWMPVDGVLEIKEEHHTQRYFFQTEMQLLLELSGFKLFRSGKPGYICRAISDTDRDIMFVAKG